MEAPKLRVRMVDLGPEASALPENFIDELLQPGSENQIANRQGVRQVARLVRSGRQAAPDENLSNRVCKTVPT